MNKAIFYDTETTGVTFGKDSIIELAGYDPDSNVGFSELINPGCHIPESATAIHGITDEMVSEAQGFAQVWERFLLFCGDDAILIAHNNDGFDVHFLRHECEKHDVILPTTWEYLDTLKWARRYRPDLPKHSLQYLREIYEIEANNAHRALDDVVVLYEVFCAMTPGLTPQEAHVLMKKPQEINTMPFGKHKGRRLEELPNDYIQWLLNSGSLDKDNNRDLRTSLEKRKLLPEKTLV